MYAFNSSRQKLLIQRACSLLARPMLDHISMQDCVHGTNYPSPCPHQPSEVSNAFGHHSSAMLSQPSLPPIPPACGGTQPAQPLTYQLVVVQCRVQCPAWMCWPALLLFPSPNWVPPVALSYSLQVKLRHHLHEQSSLLIKLDCLLTKLACSDHPTGK